MGGEGFIFEEAISKFLDIFFPEKWIGEDTFVELFSVKDRIVDFCVIAEGKILLIQTKHKMMNHVSGKVKIMERLKKMKEELKKSFYNYEIHNLILIVKKKGKCTDISPHILTSKKIWISFLRLKNYLLKKKFFTRDHFYLLTREYIELVVEYQIYERRLDFLCNLEKERKDNNNLLISLEKLKKKNILVSQKLKKLDEKIKKLIDNE